MYNFATVPVVHGRDAFWLQKYGDLEHGGSTVSAPAHQPAEHGDGHGIHIPSPSYLPVLVAMGQLMLFSGFLVGYWLSGIGLVVMLGGIYAWCSEPTAEPAA